MALRAMLQHGRERERAWCITLLGGIDICTESLGGDDSPVERDVRCGGGSGVDESALGKDSSSEESSL
jgi:hypothetical protein